MNERSKYRFAVRKAISVVFASLFDLSRADVLPLSVKEREGRQAIQIWGSKPRSSSRSREAECSSSRMKKKKNSEKSNFEPTNEGEKNEHSRNGVSSSVALLPVGFVGRYSHITYFGERAVEYFYNFASLQIWRAFSVGGRGHGQPR